MSPSYAIATMLTEDTLRNFDRFLDAIEEAVAHFPIGNRLCSLEALTKGNVPLFCLVRAGVSDEAKKAFLDYGKMQLRRETFASCDLRDRLKELHASGRLPTMQGEISFEMKNAQPQQWFHPSGSEYHRWPGQLYQIGTSSLPFLPGDPLVGRGLPPFFNAMDAVRSWTQIRVGDSDARAGRFLLFIPDFTARLDGMTFDDGALRVRSEFCREGLHISVLASDGQSTYRKTKPLRRSQSFRLMPNPVSLRVFITDENGETVDSFAEEQRWASGERVIYVSARRSPDSLEVIRHGESDCVEFKEFIRLEDRRKTADIIKAVISFANTAGGTIFIGVTDDGEIHGIDGYVPHDGLKASTFEADYFAGIRSLLQQKLNRIPQIETRSERIGDKTVFVLEVAEGIAKPYFNFQTREIFVRRGASDMRPDPDSDLRLMMDSLGISSMPWS